ncbi:MAG: hypothetical protein WC955_05880 [Elusimicrobiota bacterium]
MKRIAGALLVVTFCFSMVMSADAPESNLLKFKKILSSLPKPSSTSATGLTNKQRTSLVYKIEQRRIAWYMSNELQKLFSSMVKDPKYVEEFYTLFTDQELASLNNCLSMMNEIYGR